MTFKEWWSRDGCTYGDCEDFALKTWNAARLALLEEQEARGELGADPVNRRRYEYVRRLNVPQFLSIFKRCLDGERFDDVIDACIAGCTPQCREDSFPGCAHCMSPPHQRRNSE